MSKRKKKIKWKLMCTKSVFFAKTEIFTAGETYIATKNGSCLETVNNLKEPHTLSDIYFWGLSKPKWFKEHFTIVGRDAA